MLDSTERAVRWIFIILIVQMILIILRAAGAIMWRWVWVFTPTWGSILFVLVCGLVYLEALKRKWGKDE